MGAFPTFILLPPAITQIISPIITTAAIMLPKFAPKRFIPNPLKNPIFLNGPQTTATIATRINTNANHFIPLLSQSRNNPPKMSKTSMIESAIPNLGNMSAKK